MKCLTLQNCNSIHVLNVEISNHATSFSGDKKNGKEPSNGEVQEFERLIINRIEESQIQKVNDK